MSVHLHYKGGANSRVKKQNLISISKAPGALFRENTVTSNDDLNIYTFLSFNQSKYLVFLVVVLDLVIPL